MSNLSDPFLLDFKSELLRWNRQISLVSRRGTRRIVDNLLYQSSAGFHVIWDYVDSFVDNKKNFPSGSSVGNSVGNSKCSPFDGVLYFDLGSGGGLPGVVWSYGLASKGLKSRSFLVEPREKRAWFLDRVCGRFSSFTSETDSSVNVIAGRWGDTHNQTFEDMKCPLILISLKALHLDDPCVLDGLASFFQNSPLCGSLIIARYYPGEQKLDTPLKRSLGFPLDASAGGLNQPGSFVRCDALPVPPGGFSPTSLIVSHYNF